MSRERPIFRSGDFVGGVAAHEANGARRAVLSVVMWRVARYGGGMVQYVGKARKLFASLRPIMAFGSAAALAARPPHHLQRRASVACSSGSFARGVSRDGEKWGGGRGVGADIVRRKRAAMSTSS